MRTSLLYKVRERMPKNLDSALRIALQLEVWTKDVDRVRQDLQKDRRTRAVAKAEAKKQGPNRNSVRTNYRTRETIGRSKE